MILLYILGTVFFWVLPIILIMFSSELEYPQPTDRVLWFMLVFFLPIIGGVFYFLWLIFRAIGQMDNSQSISNHLSNQPYEPADLRRAGE